MTTDAQALIAEFRAAPLGPRSDAALELSWQMRDAHPNGRIVLLERIPGREWQIARLPLVRGGSVQLGDVLTDRAQAEWHVFTLRWFDLTGELPCR